MKANENLKFTVNISVEPYESKDAARMCLKEETAKTIGRDKMCFTEKCINASLFVQYALQGYSFCYLFDYEQDKKYKLKYGWDYPYYKRSGYLKLDAKCNEHFKGSYLIIIDVDRTACKTIDEYIGKLSYKPTLVYPSYSDNKLKYDKDLKCDILSRRFHMCFLFDRMLDKNEFKYYADCLCSSIESEVGEDVDRCSKSPAQYYNGCYGNSEYRISNLVYSVDDFPTMETIVETEPNIENENISNEIDTCSLWLVGDMQRLSYEEVTRGNCLRFNVFYRVEHDWNFGTKYDWLDIDDSYFALFYVRPDSPILDGQGRRKKLYQRMCLRRVMKPNVTADELLYNAYIELHHIVENDKDKVGNVITIDELAANVNSCMKHSVSEIERILADTIKYLKSRAPKRKRIYRWHGKCDVGMRNQFLKEDTWNRIAEAYDTSLSVKDNLKMLNDEYGLGIGKSTLYSFCKDNGIETVKDKTTKQTLDAEILMHYNGELSIRENIRILNELGYKISKSKLATLVKTKH